MLFILLKYSRWLISWIWGIPSFIQTQILKENRHFPTHPRVLLKLFAYLNPFIDASLHLTEYLLIIARKPVCQVKTLAISPLSFGAANWNKPDFCSRRQLVNLTCPTVIQQHCTSLGWTFPLNLLPSLLAPHTTPAAHLPHVPQLTALTGPQAVASHFTCPASSSGTWQFPSWFTPRHSRVKICSS